MRAYLVDDEPLAIERLARLLEKSGRVEIVGTATSPEDALEALADADIDVLFLDIQMPGLSGFELLARFERDIPVIFTTAYDRYALEAFDANSIDYLLKPIDPPRLERALDKLERLAGGGSRSPSTDVRRLAKELAAQLTTRTRSNRIPSRVGTRTTLLDVSRITHFVAKDKVVFAIVGGREHAVDGTLNDIEERLDPGRFVRIHRATLVNIGFVQELYPGVKGLVVRLKDDARTELAVARDRVRSLKDRLGIAGT